MQEVKLFLLFSGSIVSPGFHSSRSKVILKSEYWFGIPSSDPQTLKSVKIISSKNRLMTIHALVRQCALSVLSYSECKIAKYFMRLFPLGRAYRTLSPQTHQLHNSFSACYACWKTDTHPRLPHPPPILLDTALVQSCPLFSDTVLILLKSFILLDFCSPAAYVNLIFLPLTVYMYKFVSCWSKAKKLSLKKTAEKYDLYMTMWKRV